MAKAAGSAHRIVALPGDGIGPEVLAAARELLNALEAGFGLAFEVEELPVGGVSIDEHGVPLLPEVLDRCATADAVLLGAVGGPKWDTTDPEAPRPEQGLLAMRKGLELFANLRPVRLSPALAGASPLREELVADADLVIVRELTGGIYFGDRGRHDGVAYDTCVYSVEEIERIARMAFGIAGSASRRGKVTSLDNAAMQLVARPASFDVVLTENMFGDILSDEAAMIAGSIGLLASASLGADGPGLFEPVHGSAPDIAGRGVANPLAMFGSVALMLRHSLAQEAAATAVESAIDSVLERGLRTPDLAAGHVYGGPDEPGPAMSDIPEEIEVGTAEMTAAVVEAVARSVAR